MTSKFIVPVVLSLFFASCTEQEGSDNTTTPTEILVNISVYPAQQAVVIRPANLRLSFTGRTVTDSSVFYQVSAIYEGKAIGFNLSVPRGETGKAWFSPREKASNELLRQLEGLYGLPVDSLSHFGTYIGADCSSLGALLRTPVVAGDVATDTAAHLAGGAHPVGGVAASTAAHDSASRPQQKVGSWYRLLFRSRTTPDTAELYLDINEQDHWVELAEKDSTSRARLIRCLAGN